MASTRRDDSFVAEPQQAQPLYKGTGLNLRYGCIKSRKYFHMVPRSIMAAKTNPTEKSIEISKSTPDNSISFAESSSTPPEIDENHGKTK